MDDNDVTGTWLTIARGLAALSVLGLAAGFVLVVGNTGVSARDRLFQASESAQCGSRVVRSGRGGSAPRDAYTHGTVATHPRRRPRRRSCDGGVRGVRSLVFAHEAQSFSTNGKRHRFRCIRWTELVVSNGRILAATTGAVMGALILVAARRATTIHTVADPFPDFGQDPSARGITSDSDNDERDQGIGFPLRTPMADT